MFNHLPWYTERKNDLSSRLNAAESMRAAALLNAPPRAVAQRDDDDSNSLSGSDAGSEEFDAELVEAGGDTTVQSIGSEASFAPTDAGSSLPPLADARCSPPPPPPPPPPPCSHTATRTSARARRLPVDCLAIARLG
jgi:hypothetical protein